MSYCYEGKSQVVLRKFEGQSGPPVVQNNPDCPVVPYHQIYSTSMSGSVDVAAYPNDISKFFSSLNLNLQMRTLLRMKSGVLFAGGFEYIPYSFSPVLYKSTDEGKTWTLVNFHGPANVYGIINDLVEDSKGNLYVAGFGFLGKSEDGGNTWKILPNQISVRHFIILKDDALLVIAHAYDRNVYKSTDGGLTWNILFKSNNVGIRSIIEGDNGDLIYSGDDALMDAYGAPGLSIVFKYSHGQISSVLSYSKYAPYPLLQVYPLSDFSNSPLLKAKDGTIYFSVSEQKKLGNSFTYPMNVLYASSDNGASWKKVGDIWEGWDLGGSIIRLMEGSDGSLYAALPNTKCWGSTIFKSVDKGRKWSVLSGDVPGLSHALEAIPWSPYGLEAMIEQGNKILYIVSGIGGVIFVNP